MPTGDHERARTVWQVVGGVGSGGIIVRALKGTDSPQEETRLSHGALVEELERAGGRVKYRQLSGTGPFSGWVSESVQARELLRHWGSIGGAPPGGSVLADNRVQDAETDGQSHVELLRYAPWLSRCGLERVANFRDAAGADPAAGPLRCVGGHVKRGQLFRTGHWCCATEADQRLIRDELGIRTYIDLRNGSGLEASAGQFFDDFPPCPSGRHSDSEPRLPGERRRVHCPFLKDFFKNLSPKPQDAEAGDTLVSRRRKEGLQWYRNIAPMAENGLVHSLCCSVRYMMFVNPDEVLRALRVLTDPANYPVAYGCMAGKDRTGLFGLLVLRILGVSDEDIASDFLATNSSAAHIKSCVMLLHGQWTQDLKEKRPKEFLRLARQQGTSPSDDHGPIATGGAGIGDLSGSMVYEVTLRFAMHVLDVECGGSERYLDSIGFGAEDCQRLRAALLDPSSPPAAL